MRHGGRILTDQLQAQGVGRVFSVPGESFLAVLDGLCDSGIENVVCRHEGGAAMMAEASGKMTGRPGVVFVTRGPGATNASAGVHVAMQDATPMILFVGQIARQNRDRQSFQEIDYRAFFGPLAKWAAEIDQTDRIPEYVNRAFHVATSGRPGPVVLALPEDMLSASADVPVLAPTAAPKTSVSPEAAERTHDMLDRAERPLVIAGGGGWSAEACADLARFAAAQGLPVATSFRRQDLMDNRLPNYVGDLGVAMNPALAGHLRDADCLLVLGARLGDITTGGHRLIDPAAPGKTIAHVHPDPDLPGSIYRTDMALTAKPAEALARLVERPGQRGRTDWTRTMRDSYQAWSRPRQTPGAVRLEQVVRHLSDTLPEDAIVTSGAGNYGAFVHRYFTYKAPGTQLSPISGSMGYGFPAAIAASLQHPNRTVVCFTGDGDFQMSLNEISTATQFGAAPIAVVANNGRYGTIRMHQERSYPGRVSGTDLTSPDYAALARAYGGHGEVVETTEDFAAAFARARDAATIAVIELRLDPGMLSTSASLGGIEPR
ncbi:MAG: thiamine pyrophosphate-binding protein [Rhodobacteraceae bacterium]|nr:thiamine pyrophosphate-binding protein [Paracoccaceae bacterium]